MRSETLRASLLDFEVADSPIDSCGEGQMFDTGSHMQQLAEAANSAP